MLTFAQNVLVLAATIIATIGLWALLDRFWPIRSRHTENDLVGWQLTVLGTIYAVVLGFMLFTAWTKFGDAELNLDLEANALRNIFRLAEGLPQPQQARIEMLSREYVDAVLNQDWPLMARGQVPETSHEINEQMWRTLMSIKTAAPSELIAEDHALSELSSLTMHRRTRLLQCESQLPTVFWGVLVIGGVLTLVVASTFTSAKAKLHRFMVFSIALLVTLVLLAIADVNRPFRGWVHVSNYAFVRAQQGLK